jgi:hypothetical protein
MHDNCISAIWFYLSLPFAPFSISNYFRSLEHTAQLNGQTTVKPSTAVLRVVYTCTCRCKKTQLTERKYSLNFNISQLCSSKSNNLLSTYKGDCLQISGNVQDFKPVRAF